jgi:hypothetical protein
MAQNLKCLQNKPNYCYLAALLIGLDKKQRKILIDKADVKQMNLIKKLFHEFLKSPATDKNIVKKLSPYLKDILKLDEKINEKNIKQKKKILNQKGGFLLPLILGKILGKSFSGGRKVEKA